MIFSLENSDNTISSYYILEDVASMINTRLKPENQISTDFLSQTYSDLIEEIDSKEVIEEIDGFKTIWGPKGERRIPSNWKLRPLLANHYELVLYNIFIRVVGIENVYPQYQIANTGHKYDFKIDYEGKKYLIEFEGIGHFKRNRYGETIHPLNQIRNFENEEYKLIIWPYWIQRCERNLKVVLGIEKQGLGAIWSSTYHFGEFPWEDSYDIIITLNNQFKIERNNGVGYMYGPDEERNYPEHPYIEQKILNDRASTWTIEKLIPKGTPDNIESKNYWLPDRLKIE